MLSRHIHEDGFSLIEILIVVVVIGILAAIAIPMFVNHQKAANNAATVSSIKQLKDAVEVARIKSGNTLMQITGNNCTRCAFSVDPLTLPDNNTGWVRYKKTLENISVAGGVDVRNLVDGYGRPLFIDENEGESGKCAKDSIGSWNDPWETGTSNGVNIHLYSNACN